MEINRIYVYAPANHKTGGVELAHQLVKLLNDNNIPCTIAYVGIKEGIHPINKEFNQYVNNYIASEKVPDEENVIVIVPEIYTTLLERFKKAKKVIWWMSVDNFEKFCGFKEAKYNFGLLRAIKYKFLGLLKDKRYTRQYGDLHLYQSEYARLYLLDAGIKNVLPLSDYINDSFFENRIELNRSNIVLYNPKKGFKFTRKIIKAYPNYEWKAIENMTTVEVADLLRRSKVYIDFGNHPGKDRFPREAAISGCCIITGKRGAAQNNIDVMIPESYKFDDVNSSIKQIGEKINYCLDSYDLACKDFNNYKKRISEEKELFTKDALKMVEFFKGI